MAVVLVVAACSSSDGEASCGEIADEAIAVIQDFVDEVSALSVDEIFSAGENVPGIDDFEARGETLQQEANDAGCSDEEMQRLLNARVGSLESDSEFGQLIFDGIQQEGFFGE